MTWATMPLSEAAGQAGGEAGADRGRYCHAIAKRQRGDDGAQRVGRTDRDVDLAGDQGEPDSDGEEPEKADALQNASQIVER